MGRLAVLLAEKDGGSIINAIQDIYSSDLYSRLEKEDTKLWHLGPVALLQEIAE